MGNAWLFRGIGAALLLSAGAVSAEETEGYALPKSESHLWLELGGDWEHYSGANVRLYPPSPDFPTSGIKPANGYGFEGKLTYRPAESQLILSVAARYGRTGDRDATFRYTFDTPNGPATEVLESSHKEHRTVVDTEVGRDVGRGWFDIYSIGSLGVRYADFETRTREGFAGPGVTATDAMVRRGLRAAGPRVAWHGSTPLPGVFDTWGVFLGWDVAGAVLFGHQRIDADVIAGGATTRAISRTHGSIIPNIEGRMDLGWHIPGTAATAKLGVRSEAFYNLLDGGLANHHSVRRVDYGPFFSVVWSLR